MFDQLNAVMTGKGYTMSNTAKNTTVTPADLVEKAKEEKLVTDVPAQAKGEKDTTPVKDETPETVDEVEEKAKKSAKDRLKNLAEKAKNNKKFFVGVALVTAAAGVTLAKVLKEKVDEAIEADVDETSGEDDTPTDSAA
jgi:preprotein translocase subunit SecF